MTRARRRGLVLFALPLAVGIAVVGGTAVPAQAATGITTPGTGAITKGSTVAVRAQVDNALNAVLQVATPQSDSFETVARGGNLLGTTHLAKTISIARNGVYRVRLAGGLTGATLDSQSFTVRIPPTTPQGLRASMSGNTVQLRWTRGPESDLTGYRVAASGVQSRTRSAADLCGNTACVTTLTFPSGASGRIPVSVTALRSDGTGGTVGSRAAASTVNLGSRPASGNTLDGPTGLPGSPPTPSLSPLQTNAPFMEVPSSGTSDFRYPAPAPQVADPAQAAPATEPAASSTSLQWGESLAISLILLVIAGHLATWTRRMQVAQAAAGSTGSRHTAPSKGPSRDREVAKSRGAPPGRPLPRPTRRPGGDAEEATDGTLPTLPTRATTTSQTTSRSSRSTWSTTWSTSMAMQATSTTTEVTPATTPVTSATAENASVTEQDMSITWPASTTAEDSLAATPNTQAIWAAPTPSATEPSPATADTEWATEDTTKSTVDASPPAATDHWAAHRSAIRAQRERQSQQEKPQNEAPAPPDQSPTAAAKSPERQRGGYRGRRRAR